MPRPCGPATSRWSTSSWRPTATRTIGFIDPTIYAVGVTFSSYATDFHDITSGKSGSYSAVTGYDLVTGWGSPKAGLITTLAP